MENLEMRNIKLGGPLHICELVNISYNIQSDTVFIHLLDANFHYFP